MSGSKDKQRRKKRGDGFDLGQNDRDFAQAEEKRKQTRTAVIILFLIAIVAVVVLVLNSNLFYRNMTALRVGNTSFSITDMNFYASQHGDFDTAAEAAQRSAILHQAAVAAGLTLTPEAQAEIDEIIRFYREDFGMHMFESANGFVLAQFGRGMNLRVLRERVEFDTLAGLYPEHFTESLIDSYTETELEAFYMEHQDNFDRVVYRVFGIPLDIEEPEDGEYEIPVPLPGAIDEEDLEALEDADEADETDELDDTEDESDELEDADDADEDEEAEPEVEEAPIAEGALGTAQLVVAAAEASGEEGFLTTLASAMGFGAEDTDMLTMRDDARVTLPMFAYGEWLLDNARQPGDATFIEGEDVIYVLYFLALEDNRYYASNVRHILIAPEPVDHFDEDMEPRDELEVAALEAAAMLEASTRADEVLAEWRAGAATEESFAELVREYSADYREEADPGLYTDLNHQTPFVTEFLDWAMDPVRQVGDVEIVRTQFGYHIMYFSGHSDMYFRHILAANEMSSEAFTEWFEEALEASAPQSTFFTRLVDWRDLMVG